MNKDLHITEELIAELEGISIRTTQGSFVSMEDVRRLAQQKKDAAAEAAQTPAPKTLNQAREAAKAYLTENDLLAPEGPREPGRSTPATDQSLSRT